MAKSESSARIVTSVVAVISAAALAVSLIAAGFAACAVPDVSTKALASVYSTDGASPFTKDELVAAAVQTKHYTIDDNDKAAVYATIAAINAQEALAGTAGKGAPKIDATANYAAGELSGEQVVALETAFDAASERYVLTPDIFDHLERIRPGQGGEIQLTDALASLARERGMLAVKMGGVRFDAGDWVDYLCANIYFGLMDNKLSESLKARLREILC